MTCKNSTSTAYFSLKLMPYGPVTDPEIGFMGPPPVAVSRCLCLDAKCVDGVRMGNREGVSVVSFPSGVRGGAQPKLNFVKSECQRKPSSRTYVRKFVVSLGRGQATGSATGTNRSALVQCTVRVPRTLM